MDDSVLSYYIANFRKEGGHNLDQDDIRGYFHRTFMIVFIGHEN